MILPFASTLYLIVIVFGERSHKLTDIRAYLPYSTERQATRKLLKLYADFSTRRVPYKQVREDCERALITYALKKTDYNVTETAVLMNIKRSTVYSMCGRLGIKVADERP